MHELYIRTCFQVHVSAVQVLVQYFLIFKNVFNLFNHKIYKFHPCSFPLQWYLERSTLVSGEEQRTFSFAVLFNLYIYQEEKNNEEILMTSSAYVRNPYWELKFCSTSVISSKRSYNCSWKLCDCSHAILSHLLQSCSSIHGPHYWNICPVDTY